jgi:LmbE family N-acetylglucosaminyl deacetylase
LSFELSPDIGRRKEEALRCHRSQVTTSQSQTPVLTDQLTEPARWRREFYVDGKSSLLFAARSPYQHG